MNTSLNSLTTLSSTPLDLRSITEALAKPPFNKQLSVIALHDHTEHSELVSILNDILIHIDSSNPTSPHNIDIRNELPSITAHRMSQFLIHGLKFDFALHTVTTLSQKIVSGDDKNLIFHILYFLLTNLEAHKKLAYLHRFCASPEIPLEFTADDVIHDLLQQLKERQDEFSQLVSRADQLNASTKQTLDLKRDIHQMEEEKQQVLGKIQLLQRKVNDIPQSTKWLHAARELRQEQQKEQKLQQQSNDLKSQLTSTQEKLDGLETSLSKIQSLSKLDPQHLMNELKDEVTSKKNLVEEKLPEQLQALEKEIQALEKTLNEPQYSPSELIKLEQDVEDISEQVKSIQDRRAAKSESQDNLTLYRQQASTLSTKKTLLTDKLQQLQVSIEHQKKILEEKRTSTSVQLSVSIPKGEAFKLYVSELRLKSNQYKQKKSELHTIQSELSVLQRTLDLLQQKKQLMQRQVSQLEQKQGVSGFTEKKLVLEQLSEVKGHLDTTNEDSVQTFSDLVKTLMNEIHAQKNQLTPAIQALKQCRSEVAQVESKYLESKTHFDAMVGTLEKELDHLKVQCQELQQTLDSSTSDWHLRMASMSLLDSIMDTMIQEMKASTESREAMREIEQQCGFKTWKEFFQRKWFESETLTKQLQTKLKEVEQNQEPHQRQLALFESLFNLLEKRREQNQLSLSKPKEPKDLQEILSPNEQRLVIR